MYEYQKLLSTLYLLLGEQFTTATQFAFANEIKQETEFRNSFHNCQQQRWFTNQWQGRGI